MPRAEQLGDEHSLARRFADGMSTSIQRGITALERRVDGAFVLLGDMPYVRAEHLVRLRAAFDPAAARLICVPVRDRKQGNPVLFSARVFPEMATLDGDCGAKSLLAEHRDVVVEVPIDDEGVMLDLDTPDAVSQARQIPG
ncbi:MAG: NTP transferase domain-containing protein [Sandaracinaceae bacterium]